MHLISDYLFEEKILFFSIVNLIFIGIIDATKQFIITLLVSVSDITAIWQSTNSHVTRAYIHYIYK